MAGVLLLPFIFFYIILITVAVTTALPLGLQWVYYRARAKGYRPPGASLISMAGVFAGAVVAALWELHNFIRGQQAEPDVFAVPAIIFTIAVLLTVVLLLTLPRRNSRISGPRRIRVSWGRYLRLSALASLTPIVVAAILCAAGKLALSWVAIVFIVAGGFAFLFYWYATILDRYETIMDSGISVDDYLAKDGRAPVLYLRPFQRDYNTFIGADEDHASFEDYFCEEFLKLSPFVALGNPEDYLPHLTGAVRVYASDHDWMQKVDELARRSRYLIAETARTSNLRLEFEHLLREGMQGKLFVFTPHPQWEHRRWLIRWLEMARFGSLQVPWKLFSTDLAKLGYSFSFGDPGPGSVITFDAQGACILLTTGARAPAEFVTPVKAWVERAERIGRCIPASCLSCGRQFYLPPADAGAIRERWCGNCEEGLTWLERNAKDFAKRHQTLVALVGSLVWFGGAITPCFLLSNNYIATALALLLLVVNACLLIMLLLWFRNRIFKRVVKKYLSLAEAGDAVAMTNLGIINRGSRDAARNDALSAKWFSRAAEAGDIGGMIALADMLESGRGGLRRDAEEAAHWYRRAAQSGSYTAGLALERLSVSE